MEIPWTKIFALVFILIASTVLSLVKGGGGGIFASIFIKFTFINLFTYRKGSSIVGIRSCTVWYWVAAAAIFPIIFVVWGYEGFYAIKVTHQKLNGGEAFIVCV